ncbi:MAG: radical SAM protein [Spirochaetia bacterium]|nr:radical SAM protein [Spirochaetia bacterium]
MRVAFVYPPFLKDGKIPLLGQNRQFKYTHSGQIKIFPLIPAYTVTMLKQAGHEALFLDAINRGMDGAQFEKQLFDFKPDMIVLETKTPIIKDHWKWADYIKLQKPECKLVFTGDHVSFFPEETLQKCKADYVAAGGDFDVSILNLVRYLEGRGGMPAGIYYRAPVASLPQHAGIHEIKNSGRPMLFDNLDSLPFIDRDLTRWSIYGEAYLYRPAAYILSGRGCGREGKELGGTCTFCIWQHAFWQRRARLRSAKNVADEIEMLVKKYGVYEIFDDNESGPVWSQLWLEEFLHEIEKRGLKGKFVFSCNARAENLTEEKCRLMKAIGFRLLKVGLESGSTETLHRIGKLETVEEIMENVKRAKRYGFRVMLTMMVGYPWETVKDVKLTYKAAKNMMLYKTHFGDSLQASIIMPYPGTPLYREAENNGWLTDEAKDYEKMDMEHDILKSNYDNARWCKKMWNIHKNPLFLMKSLLTLRDKRDWALAVRGVKSLVGHTKDY